MQVVQTNNADKAQRTGAQDGSQGNLLSLLAQERRQTRRNERPKGPADGEGSCRGKGVQRRGPGSPLHQMFRGKVLDLLQQFVQILRSPKLDGNERGANQVLASKNHCVGRRHLLLSRPWTQTTGAYAEGGVWRTLMQIMSSWFSKQRPRRAFSKRQRCISDLPHLLFRPRIDRHGLQLISPTVLHATSFATWLQQGSRKRPKRPVCARKDNMPPFSASHGSAQRHRRPCSSRLPALNKILKRDGRRSGVVLIHSLLGPCPKSKQS